MLRRGHPKSSAGQLSRAVLTPIADSLGLDYNEATLSPPVTDEAATLEAFRCGVQLLMASVYADGWPEGHRKQARKAARAVEERLLAGEAQEAVGHMAAGYGRAMAELWRHAATTSEYVDNAGGLIENAARSDELAARVEATVPVTDEWGVLAEVATAARMRFVRQDLDGPDGDAVRALVNGEAQALALGPHYHDVEIVVIEPVMSLDLRLNAALLADWGFVADYWSNAISDDPLSYAEMTQLAEAEHG